MGEPRVVLPPLAGGQRESWIALVELAPTLDQNWLLVGGQMVFLLELERRATEVRPTDDVDVVVDLRAEPTGLARVHAALVAAGFVQDDPSPDGAAHRYRRGPAVFDVLAPDNVGDRAQLRLGAGRTIEGPARLRSSSGSVDGPSRAIARRTAVVIVRQRRSRAIAAL